MNDDEIVEKKVQICFMALQSLSRSLSSITSGNKFGEKVKKK
jgi:hypothetical protein